MLYLFRRYLRPYAKWLVIGPLFKIVEVVFDIINPLVIAWMIDDGVLYNRADVIVKGGIALFVMAVAGFCFTLVTQKVAGMTSQGFAADVRSALYERINQLSFKNLDEFSASGLLTNMTADVNQLQLAVTMLIRQVIRWPVLAVGSVVAALSIDLKLGVIFCVTVPVIAVIFFIIMKKSIPHYAAMQSKLDAIGRVVRETLSGVRPIRAYRRQETERVKFDKAADDQADIAIAVGKLSSFLSPATFIVMNLAICAILWQGGVAVDNGRLEPGQVMAFISYMNQLLVSIVFVASLVVIYTRAWASGARIQRVLETEPAIKDTHAGETLDIDPAAPAVEFKHVGMAYADGADRALDDVCLTLPAGGSLGVIGGTGSGKSTLVNVLARLYEVGEGAVEVRGHDVRDYSFDQLHELVALVPQKASLISGTIRDNLLWRDDDATDGELWRALELAQGAEFVRNLPDGLDSRVEAGGKNFSGGQRQRLTIARALVGPAAVVVLDDSSSALDYATDAKLRAALAGLGRQGLASVIVSQRVASVSGCDAVCVLDAGRVVGLGKHDELIETCPVYAEICASQFKQEDGE